MTKYELKARLESGEIMDRLFRFRSGQDCMIFKADRFQTGNEILYIPDAGMNDIPLDSPIIGRRINEVLSCCYTGNDFEQACRDAGVNEEYAERLFQLCDWQHPSTILGEGWSDKEDE